MATWKVLSKATFKALAVESRFGRSGMFQDFQSFLSSCLC